MSRRRITDAELCKLARDALKRMRVAWRYATPEQTHSWNRDLRIFIDATPAVAAKVNKILYVMGWYRITPRAALKKLREREHDDR